MINRLHANEDQLITCHDQLPRGPIVHRRMQVEIAWRVDPKVALSMAQRFPSSKEVASELQRLLSAHAHEPRVQALPQAGMMLAANTVRLETRAYALTGRCRSPTMTSASSLAPSTPPPSKRACRPPACRRSSRGRPRDPSRACSCSRGPRAANPTSGRTPCAVSTTPSRRM